MYVIASNSEFDYSESENQWELTWSNMFWAFSRITFHSSMLIYFAILAVGQTLNFNAKLRDRELLTSKLKVDLVSAQLTQLRSQLQPHFLFNTLSAVTTFVDTNPKVAKTLIVRLSELLRAVVDQPSIKTRSVAEEMEFIRKYIEIETIRFGDRLVFEEQIDPEAMQIQIPFLLLQPIIENAIKHGVCELAEPCFVKVSIEVVADRIEIIVSDTGTGFDSDALVEGVGVSNTRSRLKHLYGQEFRFDIENSNRGVSVELSLPLQTSEAVNE